MIDFKGSRFEKSIILEAVRWCVTYPSSYRQIEELMDKRAVSVDHSSIQKWVVKYSPQLDASFKDKKKVVGKSWKLDENFVKVNGQWKYLYRVIDNDNQSIDFLHAVKRDKKAALWFLRKAIGRNSEHNKVSLDKIDANKAVIDQYNADQKTQLKVNHNKYMNNVVEQDHKGAKRIINPAVGFKEFYSAQMTIVGIEVWRMITKDQKKNSKNEKSWEQFYSLAA